MSVTPSGRRRSGKAADVIAILERRVRGGDYLVAPLPAERELAAELGVSYMTARKAVLVLQERGLLERGPTGRLRLAGRGGATRVAQIAFLAPAWPSVDIMRWRLAIDRITANSPCAVKSHFFVHWDDPALLDIMEKGDGAFLYPSSEQMSPTLARRIRERAHRVVVVDQDWSRYGLPSLCLNPPAFIHAILDHCAARGYQRIACLNTQPHDEAITALIAQYLAWAHAHGRTVDLIDHPVRAVGEDAGYRAREVIAGLLRDGRPAFDALCALTEGAAVGAMRALHSAGLTPGRDLGVCTLNDSGVGELTIPSLTAQAPADPEPFLRVALEWMLHPDRVWQGPLLLQPEVCAVAVRESTGGLVARSNARP